MRMTPEQFTQRQNFRQIKQLLYIGVNCWLAMCLLMTAGCAGFTSVDAKFDGPIPSSRSANVHIVKPKETLFSVAWRYGWDYKELASANSISAPYIIYPGQKLNVGRSSAKKVYQPNKNLTKSKSVSKRPVASAYKSASEPPKPASTGDRPDWVWPSEGKLIAKFSSKTPINKGIDIAGRLGESVHAAAAGSVVYAGSGLLGYGNLVIVKHNDEFLSAYAHNKRLLVKENQQVKAGQVIAEIGSSGTDKVKLHFEIRRQGKPVDPLRYLPKVRK